MPVAALRGDVKLPNSSTRPSNDDEDQGHDNGEREASRHKQAFERLEGDLLIPQADVLVLQLAIQAHQLKAKAPFSVVCFLHGFHRSRACKCSEALAPF